MDENAENKRLETGRLAQMKKGREQTPESNLRPFLVGVILCACVFLASYIADVGPVSKEGKTAASIVGVLFDFQTLVGGLLALCAAWWTIATMEKTEVRATLRHEDQVGLSREIGERQTRAYICIDFAKFEEPISGKPIKAIVAFKNTGQSPAYNVSGWCKIIAGEKAYSDSKGDGGKRPIIQFGDIGGNVSRSFPHPAKSSTPYTPGIARHIKNFGRVYAFGEISYYDAFNRDNNIRRTEFVYVYMRNLDSHDDLTMLAHTEGNYST